MAGVSYPAQRRSFPGPFGETGSRPGATVAGGPLGLHPRVRPRVWSRALVQKLLKRYCDKQCHRHVDWGALRLGGRVIAKVDAADDGIGGGVVEVPQVQFIDKLFVFVSDSHCSVSGLRSLGLLDSSGVAFSLVRQSIHWRGVSPRRQGGRALGSPWTFSREPWTARVTSSDRRGRQQQLGEGALQRGRALRLSLRCGEEDVKQTHLTRR